MIITGLGLAMALAGAQPATVPARAVYVCERDIGSARAFRRNTGAEASFVTADQALKDGQRWESPRCITSGEHRKLRRELDRRSAPQQRASRD